MVADVPVVSDTRSPDGHTPTTLVTRILVADVNAASMRALNYAQSLAADDVRAVFFATAARRGAQARGGSGLPHGTAVPLEVLRGALPRHRRSAPQLRPRADEPTRTSP